MVSSPQSQGAEMKEEVKTWLRLVNEFPIEHIAEQICQLFTSKIQSEGLVFVQYHEAKIQEAKLEQAAFDQLNFDKERKVFWQKIQEEQQKTAELKWDCEALNEIIRDQLGMGQGEIDSLAEDTKQALKAKEQK